MLALAAIALVWLGTDKPSGRAKDLLDAWGERHGVQFIEPAAEASPADDEMVELGQRGEQALDLARDQLTAGDGSSARQTLARLEQMLREHTMLLQSSWLMAERYRLEAQIARSDGLDDAQRWDARADALEGQRAPAFGETGEPRAAPAHIEVKVTVRGARQYAIFWDGARSAGSLDTVPGEHHLLIVRGTRVAWSGWVSTLTPGTVDVWVRDAPPCSAADLAGVAAVDAGAFDVPAGVRCQRWSIAANALAPGAVRVALCRQSQCEPFETESQPTGAAVASKRESAHGIPAWALWTLAGVGAAVATSVVLWRTGVFDRADKTMQVVYDGSKL
jgi:hypothetical protein